MPSREMPTYATPSSLNRAAASGVMRVPLVEMVTFNPFLVARSSSSIKRGCTSGSPPEKRRAFTL